MSEQERYRAVEDGVVWALLQFGLITQKQADANTERWRIELAHMDSLRAQAEREYEKLPLLKRLWTDKWTWSRKWREQHDTWITE